MLNSTGPKRTSEPFCTGIQTPGFKPGAVDQRAVVAVLVAHQQLAVFDLQRGVDAGDPRLAEQDAALRAVPAGLDFDAGDHREHAGRALQRRARDRTAGLSIRIGRRRLRRLLRGNAELRGLPAVHELGVHRRAGEVGALAGQLRAGCGSAVGGGGAPAPGRRVGLGRRRVGVWLRRRSVRRRYGCGAAACGPPAAGALPAVGHGRGATAAIRPGGGP